jgi:Mor family transcriptional regulator
MDLLKTPAKSSKKTVRKSIYKIPVPDETINEIVAKVNNGETMTSLSKEYKVSLDCIYGFWLKSHKKPSEVEVEIVNPEDVMLANC